VSGAKIKVMMMMGALSARKRQDTGRCDNQYIGAVSVDISYSEKWTGTGPTYVTSRYLM